MPRSRILRKGTRAPWGSKTRGGQKINPDGTPGNDKQTSPSIVPKIETIPLSQLWNDFDLNEIHELAEQGAVVTFGKRPE